MEIQCYLNEVWRPVKGYEGLYEVSNFGRVKSLSRISWNGHGYMVSKEFIMKQQNDKCGYLNVTLCKNGIQNSFKVHRLVAIAFIPNPNNYPEVNHVDENKKNNCVENLEWCDRKYNNNYGTRNEKVSKPVKQYTLDGKHIATYASALEAEKETGVSHFGISKCCLGKVKSAGIKYGAKFKWEFAS